MILDTPFDHLVMCRATLKSERWLWLSSVDSRMFLVEFTLLFLNFCFNDFRILSIIVKNTKASEKNINELGSFRHHLRITNGLNIHKFQLKKMRKRSPLDDFELWKLLENQECTNLKLIKVMDLGLDFHATIALSKTIKFISNSLENYKYLTKLCFGDDFGADMGQLLYKDLNDEIKAELINFFKNCPALTELKIKRLCDGKYLFYLLFHTKVRKLGDLMTPKTKISF